MRHRPTERRAVVALLEKEWEDTGDLAEAVLDTLLDLKWKRGGWVVIQGEPMTPPVYMGWGPYDTRNQAMRDVGRRITAASEGARALVVRVCNWDAQSDVSDAAVTMSLFDE